MPPNAEADTTYSKPISEKVTASKRKDLGTENYPLADAAGVNIVNNEKKEIEEIDEITKTGEQLNIEYTTEAGWFTFKTQLIWPNIIGITLLHIGTLYTLTVYSFIDYKMLTLWGLITGGMGGFGVTGGVHRLWTHRAYKANLPLRIIVAGCYLVAGENSIYNWVRDHRIHHKFSETSADPHDSNRGFFFSHVGWLMMKKHPEVIRRGKQVDMSDVTSDPVVQFVEKHFSTLKLLACFILPILIPVYCWNEEWRMTILSQLFIRYPFTLNATWSVNSFAHFWGSHSYDKSIRPAENKWVAFAAMGEGWHNYHHAFPWDYKAAELGNYRLNLTTMLIDGFAKIGWAYDLKRASTGLVKKVTENRGDGSHAIWGKSTNN